MKHFFITPYLEEIDRVIVECPDTRFATPEYINSNTKSSSLIALLKDSRCIACTHKLFSIQNWSNENVKLLYNYTLIFDEVLGVIQNVECSKPDFDLLIKSKLMKFEDDGSVKWLKRNYSGKFSWIMSSAKRHSLYYDYVTCVLYWCFPLELLQSVKNIVVLTFMFESSHFCCYLRAFKCDYEKHYLHSGEFIAGEQMFSAEKIRRINGIELYGGIYNDLERHNRGQEPRNIKLSSKAYHTVLSYTWYQRNLHTGSVQEITNKARNCFRTCCKAKGGDTLWTCFTDARRLYIRIVECIWT